MLVRELPVAAPHELVNLAAPGPKEGTPSCGDIGTCEEVFSYPMFRDLERLPDSPFVGIAAHRDMNANIAIDGQTVAGSGLLVSGNYFSLLGLQAAVGRLLDSNDDRVDGEASAVVLSYAYWESAFAADPGVVGRDARRQRQAADDRRRRAARILGHDGQLAAAGVPADLVPLARQPVRDIRITPTARSTGPIYSHG